MRIHVKDHWTLLLTAGTTGAMLTSLSGCDDPLVDPQSIKDMRIIGARAMVIGDEQRATPQPGEQIRVDFLVAGPNGTIATTYAFTGCEAADSAGTPLCLTQLATLLATSPTVEPPSIEMTVPTEAERISVHGIVCDGGSPTLGDSVDAHRCSALAAKGTPTWLDVYVGEQPANHNPAWSHNALMLDGEPWPATREGHCSLTTGRGDHTIALDLSGMREANEPLVVSHYVTAGELERHYSAIEPEAPEANANASISWRAPAAPDPTLVSFFFVARDERGGVDWARRDLCLAE